MAGMDGFGVQLQRGDGAATEVFTTIADVTSLNPPNISRETLDVTSHDSPNGWMQFLGSLKDPGEVSADVNYQPDKHDLLVSDFEDATPATTGSCSRTPTPRPGSSRRSSPHSSRRRLTTTRPPRH